MTFEGRECQQGEANAFQTPVHTSHNINWLTDWLYKNIYNPASA